MVRVAKRVQKDIKAAPSECTQYQLHKTQLTVFAEFLRTTYDFTEFRLRRCIEEVDDSQKLVLTDLLNNYVRGNVAIAWLRGQPLHINVTKA